MIVSNEEIAVVFILHLHEIAEGAEIVAQMEVASGADAAANDVFAHIA
jgi:hypothetical protein